MWTKLADEFLEDETVCALRDRAYRLHVSAMVYSGRNLTDGVITEKQLKVIQAIVGYQVKRFVAELVDAGLWLIGIDGAYRIKNFLKYNPSAAEVKADRERNAKRQKDYRERHKSGNDERDALRNDGSNGAPTRPDPKERNPKALTAPDQNNIKNLIDQSLKEAS